MQYMYAWFVCPVSRECAEGGRSSDNATNAKEEDAPGNQDVDRDEREGMPLPKKASEGVPHG